MPTAAELRELDDDELEERLGEYRKELLNLRFQLATGQLDNAGARRPGPARRRPGHDAAARPRDRAGRGPARLGRRPGRRRRTARRAGRAGTG